MWCCWSHASILQQPVPLRWRHNGCDSVSNHQPHHCLLNRLFRRRSKKTSKLRVTGPCAGNSPGTGELPAQMASYAENVSIWWRHHAKLLPPQVHEVLRGAHLPPIASWTKSNMGHLLIHTNFMRCQEVHTPQHLWDSVKYVHIANRNVEVPGGVHPHPHPPLGKICNLVYSLDIQVYEVTGGAHVPVPVPGPMNIARSALKCRELRFAYLRCREVWAHLSSSRVMVPQIISTRTGLVMQS